MTKAQEAISRERDSVMADLKKELGRLVVETTSKVTQKVLTPEDQKRLSEETAKELAA
ncbi:MAG: hypothetical protein JO331_00320 [Verrucomicrobia bacterium]|nr:hypothetical protein [Verrucomicrobiota bacterium]